MGKANHKQDDTSTTSALLTTLDKPPLQAVILADSFLTTFQPISLDLPKVLCPLNNVALLNYAMDCLASNGVEQVFVMCTNDRVEAELQALNGTIKHNVNSDVNNNNVNNTGTWQGRMAMECIKDTSLTNAGDALRELYKRNVIQSDPFLLLFGDVVTNMDLSQAIVAHQQRHAQDSAAIMTVVLKETGASQSRIQSAKSDLVVGYDPTHQNRVLVYDNRATNKTVALPCSFFAAHPEIHVRTDLLDTGVCICSPDVLGRFEDEFDYLDIAHDFVHNCVAEEEEGLQTRIHAHIVGPLEYAARVVDWATYHAVSNDLLRRWGYPLVADNTVQSPSTTSKPQLYKSSTAAAASVSPTLSPYYLYKESVQPSKVERSSTIQGPGLLGSKGHIHDKACIRASVVGHGVTIGPGAVVEDSHIWDQVTIEANAKVIQSILAKNVIIKQGAVVSRGCVIGQGCVIGEHVVLPEYTRITLQDDECDVFGDDDIAVDEGAWVDEKRSKASSSSLSNTNNKKSEDEPERLLETDEEVVGKDGKGRVWQPSLEEDEDSDDNDDEENNDDENDDDDNDGGDETNDNHSITGISNLCLQSVGTDLTGYYQKRLQRQAETDNDGFSEGQEDDADELMETEAFARFTEGAFTFADTPASISSGDLVVVGRQKGVDVVKELKEICMEFEDSGSTPMENLAIELNSYKFSQNASYSDCTMAAILAMLDKLQITPDMTDGKLVSGFKHKLEFWAPLLQKMSIGQPEEVAIIEGLERAATSTTGEGSLTGVAQKLSKGLSFRFLLQTLHDEEVLSEGSLLAWAEKRKSDGEEDTPVGKLFRLQSVQEFLEWLEEDEDDDSSEEDDESQ